MAGKEISVKKYVVKLSGEEREQVSERGPGWSDSKIIAALDTSASMVYRVRKQLVEEGFAAVAATDLAMVETLSHA